MENLKNILRNESKNSELGDSTTKTNSVALEKTLESIGALAAVSNIRKSSLFLLKQCAFSSMT